MCVCVCVLVAKSCLTLCHPMDCSLPGSSVHGIFQARILEWVAISSSSKITPALEPKNETIKQMQNSNKFNNELKKMVPIKKKKCFKKSEQPCRILIDKTNQGDLAKTHLYFLFSSCTVLLQIHTNLTHPTLLRASLKTFSMEITPFQNRAQKHPKFPSFCVLHLQPINRRLFGNSLFLVLICISPLS